MSYCTRLTLASLAHEDLKIRLDHLKGLLHASIAQGEYAIPGAEETFAAEKVILFVESDDTTISLGFVWRNPLTQDNIRTYFPLVPAGRPESRSDDGEGPDSFSNETFSENWQAAMTHAVSLRLFRIWQAESAFATKAN